MNYGNCLTKKKCKKKTLIKQKGLYTNWNSLELFLYGVIFIIFIYFIFLYIYIYIFPLPYRILDILLFKYKLKLIKPSTYLYGNTCMIDSRKTVDIPFPHFSLKILKKHLLKAWFTWLIYISLYFLQYLIFAEI